MSDDITHLAIFRACGPDRDSESLQVRAGYRGEPPQDFMDGYKVAVTTAFEEAFGMSPARIGAVILPWSDTLDGGDDDE